MSQLTRFNPNFTVGQQRFLCGTSTLQNYLPCDGSIVSQSTYPDLYSKVGLASDGLSTLSYGTSGVGVTILSLTYGNNLFVFGGNSGTLRTSTNGITWTARTSGTTSNITALTYGNGLYVYGASNGGIATSTDAITWTARTSGTTFAVVALTYGNGLYVGAVHNAGQQQYLTSTNGITWTLGARIAGNTVRSIAYGAGVYVSGGQGTFKRSTDGLTWDPVIATPLISVVNTGAVAYIDNKFIASTGINFYYSEDGASWSSPTSPNGFKVFNIYNITAVGTTAVCVGAIGSTSSQAYTIDKYGNGEQINPLPVGLGFNCAVYGDNKFVAAGNSGLVMVATAYTYDTSTQFALPQTSNLYLQYGSPNQKAFIKYK
jgi:hypothetical protein